MTKTAKKLIDDSYVRRKAENEVIARAVNAAWGEHVAWVEDRAFDLPQTDRLPAFRGTLPVVVSRLVNGRLPGRRDCPAFFAGPAPSMSPPR